MFHFGIQTSPLRGSEDSVVEHKGIARRSIAILQPSALLGVGYDAGQNGAFARHLPALPWRLTQSANPLESTALR